MGEFENSDSPYGTFDQGGNVWEWNESIVDPVFRGTRDGAFVNGNDGYYLRASVRNYNGNISGPAYENDSLGFRVVEVPEPATLGLLLLGGLSLLKRRK